MTLELLRADQREHALRMAHALIRYNQRPDLTVHPSWLPADWPLVHRQPQRLGQRGGEVLAALLQRELPAPSSGFDVEFATPRKRLALLDGPALRRLAWYCGAALHKETLSERALRREMRRQSRRFGGGAEAYVDQRLPALSALHADSEPLRARPPAAGRIVWTRGLRVLLSLLTQDRGDASTLARVRLKLPRRLAGLRLPPLQARQRRQLEEIVTLSIVPERLPQWDWLF